MKTKLQVVSNESPLPAPAKALGVVDATGELIGLTQRGVEVWEPVFRSRGLKFSRVMKFEEFTDGVRRYAATDCSILPHVENMVPGYAKGFLCASFSHNSVVRDALLRKLEAEKTRRVAFIMQAAVGLDDT